MARTFLFAAVVAGFFAAVTCSLTKRTPGTCRHDNECDLGQVCNTEGPQNQYHCVSADGGVPGCSDDNPCPTTGLLTRCLPTTGECVECLARTHCGYTNVCDPTSHRCVGCVLRTDCSGDTRLCDPDTLTCVGCLGNPGDCTGQKPICEAKSCRACKSDSECPADPGICMEDGHCAATTEVVYVKNDSGVTCSDSGGGSLSQPFCAPAAAIGVLSPQRPVLRIDGPAAVDRALFSGLTFRVVVVGKNDAFISPGAGIGLRATAGSIVAVRALAIRGGASVGVQADAAAELHMDRCLVENNSAGGISIGDAKYEIQNSIMAGNSYGAKFAATSVPVGSGFSFNTVVGNTGNATTCDSTSSRTLNDSIVVGVNDSCGTVNCFLTPQVFQPSRPYHLMTPIGCPNGDPANPPDYDFDGDPRMSPLDCGADQHTP